MTNQVLVVNKSHIVWVIPEEKEYEEKGEGEGLSDHNGEVL